MKDVIKNRLTDTLEMLAREALMIISKDSRAALSIMKPAAAHLPYKHMSSRRGSRGRRGKRATLGKPVLQVKPLLLPIYHVKRNSAEAAEKGIEQSGSIERSRIPQTLLSRGKELK